MFAVQRLQWAVVGRLLVLGAVGAFLLGVSWNLTEEYRLHAAIRILDGELHYPGALKTRIVVYRDCREWHCALGLTRPRELQVGMAYQLTEPGYDAAPWYRAELAALGWSVFSPEGGVIERGYTAAATKVGYRVENRSHLRAKIRLALGHWCIHA